MSINPIFQEMEYKYGPINRNPTVLAFDIYQGYHLYIFSLDTHPTAYIVLNHGDKLYGKNLDELDQVLYVHGGFSYAKDSLCGENYSYVHPYEKQWVIGWDYGHYRDWAGYMSDELNQQMNNKKWTTKEILAEVHEAIDEIVKYNKGGD